MSLTNARPGECCVCKKPLDIGEGQILDHYPYSLRCEAHNRAWTLRRYQELGVQWLQQILKKPRHAALLGDPPGAGKTAQLLKCVPEGAPVLVVCPVSVQNVWREESMGRWRKEYSTAEVRRSTFRWPLRGELVTTSWGSLPSKPIATKPLKGTVLIGDEIQKVKDEKTKVHARFVEVRKAVYGVGGFALGSTGTAIENNPRELLNVLRALGLDEELWHNEAEFLEDFGAFQTAFGMAWGKPLDCVPDKLRRVSLRRRRSEILAELPPLSIQDIEVEVGAEAHAMADAAEAALKKLGVSLEQAISESIKSKSGQLGFGELARAYRQLATAKIPALLELVELGEEEDEAQIVFSRHRAPVLALAERPRWSTIHGGVAKADRDKAVAALQAGELAGLSCSIGAGGVGVTLTRACEGIFVDMAFNPALNYQAMLRLHRLGQGRPVRIRRMIADHPLDRRILEITEKKLRLFESTIEASSVAIEETLAEEDGT